MMLTNLISMVTNTYVGESTMTYRLYCKKPKPLLLFILNCTMDITNPILTLAGGTVLDPERRPEVERLRRLFEVQPAEIKEKKIPRVPRLKLAFQRPVRLMDMRRMYYYRHGTEQISNEVVRSYE